MEHLDVINATRKSLGMPLIPAGPEATEAARSLLDEEYEDRQMEATKDAESNWQKYQDQQAASQMSALRRKRLEKLRKAKERAKELEGPTLAQVGGSTDMKTWLKGQKRRVQNIQLSWEEEEARELERAKSERYSAKDLSGLKVGHNVDDFSIGSNQILTLQDREIGGDEEEDEDVLENADLRARERLKENSKALKKATQHDPFGNDDGTKKSFLSHYDEDINGKGRYNDHFTLNSKGAANGSVAKDKQAPEIAGFQLYEDILAETQQPESDFKEGKGKRKKSQKTNYENDDKPVFKKRHKAQNKRQKVRVEDGSLGDEIGGGAETEARMEIDHGTPNNGAPIGKEHPKNAADREDPPLRLKGSDDADEILLSRQLSNDQEQHRPSKAALRAERIRQRAIEEANKVSDDGEEKLGSMSMMNFLNQHLDAEAYHKYLAEIDEQDRSTPAAVASHTAKDIEAIKAMVAAQLGDDVQMEVEHGDSVEPANPAAAISFTREEKSSGSVGDTLKSLKKRGEIKQLDTDAARKVAHHQAFLEEQRRIKARVEAEAQAKKQKDRESNKFAGYTNAQKNELARQENEHREQQAAFALAEGFDQRYQPTFELEYADANGRLMNPHEAFRHMSHQFHGRTPGNNKQAKLAKKLEKERELAAHQVFDVNKQAKADQYRQEKKQPGYRLA